MIIDVKRSLFFCAACAASFLIAQQAQNFFTLADSNQDGMVTREEFTSNVARWMGGAASVDAQQLAANLDKVFPESAFMSMLRPRGPQSQTPKEEDVAKMSAALPDKAPAKPKRARKVLVYSRAEGFVHSCIPLAAKTVEMLGSKTGAWTTVVSYDAADITAANLKQYDLVFLNNTTGAFLDDSNDPAVTTARKQALLEFVRSGKGLAGIHAAGDSYHAAAGGFGWGATVGGPVLAAADKNGDKKLTAEELNAFAADWWSKLDANQTGRVSAADFRAGFTKLLFSSMARSGGAANGKPGRDAQRGTWPEFNRMIGGFFKYHWFDPQHIVYKIDDPKSPLTQMFRGGFEVNDETYTFGMDTWSRGNLRVLTSVDYSKMSDADKAKEDFPREDHDYGLSWVRREGKGRVFYEAHGHSERVYAIRPMLEHVLAGIQYALGDLKANDAPSARGKN